MPTDAGDTRRLIDDFSTTFEVACKPDVRFGSVEWRRVVGLLDRSGRADTILHAVRFFHRRFASSVELLYPPELGIEAQESGGVRLRALRDGSADTMLAAVSAADASLLVVPAPFVDTAEAEEEQTARHDSLGRPLDAILRSVAVPTLLIGSARLDADRLCGNLLVAVPDSLDLLRPLSIALSLVQQDGSLLLFHVIDPEAVTRFREVAPYARFAEPERESEAYEHGLRVRAERVLRAVEEQTAGSGPLVTSQIAFGDPVETTLRRLAGGEFGMVLVAASRDRRDVLGPMAYNLALAVANTPVLVL